MMSAKRLELAQHRKKRDRETFRQRETRRKRESRKRVMLMSRPNVSKLKYENQMGLHPMDELSGREAICCHEAVMQSHNRGNNMQI